MSKTIGKWTTTEAIRLADDGRVEEWGRQLTTSEERQRDLILIRLNEIVTLLEEIRDQGKRRVIS